MICHIQAASLISIVFFVGGCSCVTTTPQFTEDEREWTVYVGGEKQIQKERHPSLIPQAYHANRLLEGDFRTITLGAMFVRPSTRPYHLHRLIEIGEESTPTLITLLESSMTTGFMFTGRPEISFDSGIHALEEWESSQRHEMTVGDLASYALRAIHQQDFGFRSYRGDIERNEAICHWEGYWLKKSSNLASPFIELPDNPDTLPLE